VHLYGSSSFSRYHNQFRTTSYTSLPTARTSTRITCSPTGKYTPVMFSYLLYPTPMLNCSPNKDGDNKARYVLFLKLDWYLPLSCCSATSLIKGWLILLISLVFTPFLSLVAKASSNNAKSA